MLNNVSLVGRFTKEPEMKVVGEHQVCNFTLAVNRPFKNKDGDREADFIQCQAWNKQAEFIATFLTKGQLVAVTGEIHTRSYAKDDGSTNYITEVNVSSIQSLEKCDPQTEEAIKTQWTKEWDQRVASCKTQKEKDALKTELAQKYQKMIDALKKPSSDKDDLPF